jgi:8-oxo-dGTP pyrophosphatase MutT (NUDIX family)
MAVTPHKATTVILVRQKTSKGFEVFLVRRHDNSAFMGGNYVYPGGRVDPADQSTDVLSFCRGLSPEKASEILGYSPPIEESIGYWVAGIRELFEEAGILLAYDSGGKILSWVNRIGQEKLLHYRESLHRKDFSLSHLAQEEKIFLALDQLHYYAHWITPEARSVRFDTRFFVALHPSGQEASHDQRETTHGLWITPHRALEENLKGEVILSPPTLKTLEDLSRFSSIDDVLRSLQGKNTSPILPVFIKLPSEILNVFPWDPEYNILRKGDMPPSIEHGRLSEPGDNTTRVVLREGRWYPYCRT